MLVRNGFGQQRHSDYDYTGHSKEDHPEVQVVYAAYNCGTVAWTDTVSCAIDELRNHPG